MVKEAKKHIAPLIDSGLSGDFMAVAFDIRVYYVESDLLKTNSINNSTTHIKVLRKIARYLINEKASVPQVKNKAEDLKRLMSEDLWKNPTVDELEKLRISLRDLMPFLQDSGRKKYEIDIQDEIEESEYQPESTSIDIRTYREKVIDYLVEHSDNPVIKKIYNLEPINNDDLKELEKVLWHELGSQEDYTQTTSIDNLAAFVRSLIGLSQEAVNERFGEYLSGNTFNSQQQEFVQTIINYVRENVTSSLKTW
jgi:type I restriction enzyme R subunit